MKTSELTGAALDWAVCEATGLLAAYTQFRTGKNFLKVWGVAKNAHLHPSTNWSQGGPFIEREDINVTRHTIAEITESRQEVHRKDGWTAFTTSSAYWMTPIRCYGPTPLIAAMRCYVASKLGDTVDVPKELTK
jgi:hypothetical protein